jgi:non-ribosomal peptide synthetase component F
VIGFISNTLVFRSRLEGNPTFRELLERIRAMALDVYTHQGVPLEKVVEALRPEREPGVNPLFQVNLRTSGSRRAILDLPGTEVAALSIDSGFSRFDLALDLDLLPDAIEGYFRFNRDIFEPATIARLADEFNSFLTQALEDPDRRLLSFALLSNWSTPARPSAPGPRPRARIE